MRERARSAYAQINGQSAPFYGLAAALAMAIPLLAGSLTGRAAQGSMIALGAYLVALRAPEGPYGNRARDLASGVLMVAVGFSAGQDTGIWAIIIYFGVQTFDGYVLIPLVAKRTVDLPPALTLGAQILSSTLFGVMGLALADPMVAMIKVALESEAERAAAASGSRPRVRWRGRRGGSIEEPAES